MAEEKEMYELNANGSFITPQMGRVVREKAPAAVEVRVHPKQMKKIADLFEFSGNADTTISKEGHRFAGLHLNQDQAISESEMRFYDKKGNLVAKIVGLER